MPLSFHVDRSVMHDQQYRNARSHVIPFVAGHLKLEGSSVLDIGCGEGGVLRAFAEAGCRGLGVDLSASRAEEAERLVRSSGVEDRLRFVSGDIHDESVSADWSQQFDLVVLKDVIEHVPEKERLMRRIATFLRPDGMVFLGFPPWRMPFGGHQQITASPLGKTPYLHLAPKSLYLRLMRLLGEREGIIRELGNIHDTRISISKFERLVSHTGFRIVDKTHFLVNPIYQFKFGLSPREQLPGIRSLPVLRDFVTTACFYLVAPEDHNSAQ
jgi:SAM-dependent methyltransferase